jgi:hypothetical protein
MICSMQSTTNFQNQSSMLVVFIGMQHMFPVLEILDELEKKFKNMITRYF